MNNKLIKYGSEDLFNSNWLKSFFDLPIVTTNNVLKTNISKVGDKYVYEIDIPGYNKEDVTVSYEEGYLIVEAKNNKTSSYGTAESYIRQERYTGTCSRSYYIGEIDENKIEAKYNNGILIISFKGEEKEQKYKTKKINIQ